METIEISFDTFCQLMKSHSEMAYREYECNPQVNCTWPSHMAEQAIIKDLSERGELSRVLAKIESIE